MNLTVKQQNWLLEAEKARTKFLRMCNKFLEESLENENEIFLQFSEGIDKANGFEHGYLTEISGKGNETLHRLFYFRNRSGNFFCYFSEQEILDLSVNSNSVHVTVMDVIPYHGR